MNNVRNVALDILMNIEKKKSYVHIEVNKILNKRLLSSKDEVLLLELVQGTLKRYILLDYLLEPFLKKKIELWVRILLRLSLYQMNFLDRIPDHAIIHEAVEIAKNRGHAGIAKMVNGVLRNIQRTGVRDFTLIRDKIKRLEIETSTPEWLASLWRRQYGFAYTEQMCQTNLRLPVQTVRVNTWRGSSTEILKKLKQEGFEVERHPLLADCIINHTGNLARTSLYKEGLITVQDASSQLVGMVVNPQKGERILDACSAPGGKVTHILELLQGSGEVVALDLHKLRLQMVQAHIKRLHLPKIETHCIDARSACNLFSPGTFDKIILDVPCSGLGVIRRKPDIKYEKEQADFINLLQVQADLLKLISPLLKVGGRLIYSTCTVNKLENEQIVTEFLANNKDKFEADKEMAVYLPTVLQRYVHSGMIQIFPQTINSDGFFIASIVKKDG